MNASRSWSLSAILLLAGSAVGGDDVCFPEGPWLVSPAPVGGDQHGQSVAVDGDWIAVGAPLYSGAATNEGRVHLFQRGPQGWSPAGTLAGSQVDENDAFGHAVALDGNTLVVGASEFTDYWPNVEPGRVYVFERTGTDWNEVFVWGPGGTDISRFGTSVAIDGDRIVVGAPFDDGGALNAGALWVFERAPSWSLQQKLVAPNPTPGEAWGWSVTVSGSRLAGGAVQGIGLGPGCVRIFEESGSSWTPTAELVPTDGIAGDWFGVDVSMAGGELAIGAPFAGAVGAVYVYELLGPVWTPQPRYIPGGVFVNQFGATVALSGDAFVAGDEALSPAPILRGRAIRYVRGPGTWIQAEKIQPAGASPIAAWGSALDLDGETLVLGGPLQEVPTSAGTYLGAAAAYLLADASGTLYCTPKTNSGGCIPAIATAGTASMSAPQPFTLDATNVMSLRAGLPFFGITGPAAVPFQGGTLCVFPPLRRAPILWSGGNQPPDCSGAYTFDFNAYVQAGNEPAIQAGMPIHAQYWYRDPGHPDGTGVGLTDAVSFAFCN